MLAKLLPFTLSLREVQLLFRSSEIRRFCITFKIKEKERHFLNFIRTTKRSLSFSTAEQFCFSRTIVYFNLMKIMMLVSDLVSFFLLAARNLRLKAEVTSERLDYTAFCLLCSHLFPGIL